MAYIPVLKTLESMLVHKGRGTMAKGCACYEFTSSDCIQGTETKTPEQAPGIECCMYATHSLTEGGSN
jgi:hypothetical protein